jgi:hypothetical protein
MTTFPGKCNSPVKARICLPMKVVASRDAKLIRSDAIPFQLFAIGHDSTRHSNFHAETDFKVGADTFGKEPRNIYTPAGLISYHQSSFLYL